MCPGRTWLHESGSMVGVRGQHPGGLGLAKTKAEKSGMAFAEKPRIWIHLCSVLSGLPTGLPVSSIRPFPAAGRSSADARQEVRKRKRPTEGGGEVMKSRHVDGSEPQRRCERVGLHICQQLHEQRFDS